MIRVLVAASRWLLLAALLFAPRGAPFCAVGRRGAAAVGDSAAEHSVGADHELVAVGMPAAETQAFVAKTCIARGPRTSGPGLVDGNECKIDFRSPIDGAVPH